MWFKNLLIYRLDPNFSVSAPELEEKLAQRSLKPCGSFDMQSRGWVHSSPAQRYVHSSHGQHLIALGVEEKLLPASIIRQVATERAKEVEQQQGYPVGRRQMRELKERVTEELRARALTRRRTTRAWMDPKNFWFIVDAAGGGRADEVTETLRDTIGSLPVQLLDVERSPQTSMAAWMMLGDAPMRFAIDQDLELQAVDQSKASIRYAKHTLDGKEIKAYLGAGMYVSRLGLTWNDRISFVLTEKLNVKRLEFIGISNSKSDEQSALPPEEQFDIDFALMCGELSKMLTDLVEALGGETARAAAA